MFAFSFGDDNNLKIPAFQFSTIGRGIVKVVPDLFQILQGINDYGVFQWLTAQDTDLSCTPAEAILSEDNKVCYYDRLV
ncbi:hypothetical protein L3V77_12180 [Vibrio sp. DW001]|uniref:hypothetical protein n=1 Tax=Vibrio sp. DW001 TaxID=2912315 RepID=UPI0023B1662C|nr:hypothetical protein [Vibrio sp. DW001]WED25800.1 hypothetical protein L3V77_12180 [Vibrio sp. DW001]